MKKLFTLLSLVFLLVISLSTPALAGGPENFPDTGLGLPFIMLTIYVIIPLVCSLLILYFKNQRYITLILFGIHIFLLPLAILLLNPLCIINMIILIKIVFFPKKHTKAVTAGNKSAEEKQKITPKTKKSKKPKKR